MGRHATVSRACSRTYSTYIQSLDTTRHDSTRHVVGSPDPRVLDIPHKNTHAHAHAHALRNVHTYVRAGQPNPIQTKPNQRISAGTRGQPSERTSRRRGIATCAWCAGSRAEVFRGRVRCGCGEEGRDVSGWGRVWEDGVAWRWCIVGGMYIYIKGGRVIRYVYLKVRYIYMVRFA